MQLAKVLTRALVGVRAPEVIVEVHISNGLPSLSIVGLPEAAVRESKDRVRAAIINSCFDFPMQRVTVNLAPADLPKAGGRFDLPIAIGILAASGQISSELLDNHEFHGELALSGQLRPINGSLPIALAMQDSKKTLILPADNAREAALVERINIRSANNLLDICAYLQQQGELDTPAREPFNTQAQINKLDFSDVIGQFQARRAIEIAAAGGHNLLMIGPPGTGKSMLASRMPGILPPMSDLHALEQAAISSISYQGFDIQNWKQRPFRSPHHTASGVALVGGGSNPSPGEISLAHHGILFLDELTEFQRHTLDVLREPLETGTITISRAARQADFPARFQLIAAMNPCPQGYSCDGKMLCQCTIEQQKRHRSRISAPLLDRIDIHIEVPKLDADTLHQQRPKGETSRVMRQRVLAAFERQMVRCGKNNAALNNDEINQYCFLGDSQQHLLNQAMEKLNLSARAYHRILKLARTIADIENSETIETAFISEAISYRSVDRLLN